MKFIKNLRNVKVKKRLMLSFCSVVGFASFAGVLGLIFMLLIDGKYSTALIENGFIQGEIGQYNAYLNKSSALARDVITAVDSADLKSAQADLSASDEKLDIYLNSFKNKLRTDKEDELMSVINSKYPKYIELRDKAIDMGIQGKNEAALEYFREEARPVLIEIMNAAEELMTLNIEMGNSQSSLLSLLTAVLAVIMAVVIVLSILISVKIANHTATDIEKPIEKMQAATEKLAAGQLDARVDIHSENEFGEMGKNYNAAVAKISEYIATLKYGLSEVAEGNFDVYPNVEFQGDFIELRDSLENIIASLSRTIRQINNGAAEVSMGSDHLSDASQTLAEGATSQAAAVEELTATIEDVTVASENNAQKADEAYKDAQGFANIAKESTKEMDLLIKAMEQITETSKQIEGIIGEIEDIASQTNLLSLNASIEAARAGEAGKGFAVVADQIGKLASDSARSAVNTKTLINKSLEEVVRGNEITSNTVAHLEKLIEGINELALTSKETSELSADQAQTMSEVKQGIFQISDVIQSNSATAQESSATSEELAAQAQTLKALVEHFKLRAE